MAPPIHLVRGKDPVMVDRVVGDLVAQLVGQGDRTLMVDELDAAAYDPSDSGDPTVGPLVDAAQTPPFLTDLRVVVGRQAAALGSAGAKERLAPLVNYLADPLPSTALVVVWEKVKPADTLTAVPKPLLEAVKAAGGVVIDADPPDRAKERQAWLDRELAGSSLNLDASSRRLLAAHLGEQVNRLPEVLATVEGAFGPGARVNADDIRPWLGEAGGGAPWDLTDAIDKGDVGAALDVLGRMLDGGGRHPLQVMSSLSAHFTRMVRLDGEPIGDERAAADLLGMKGSTYPAKKALTQGRKLGTERLNEFVQLLAQADLDFRGARNLDQRTVIEVLVARLAHRSRG